MCATACQSSQPRGAGRHAGAAPGDKEPWPLLALQPQAASRSRESRLPRGYGQRPWRSQRPQRPTDIICHRSPTPVQEAPHRTGAHPHHYQVTRAKATGSASHGPPPGSRRNVQLVHRLPPRVGAGLLPGGQHAADPRSTNSLQKGWGDNPPQRPPLRAGRGDTSRADGHRPLDQLGPYTNGVPHPSCNTPNRRGAEEAPRQRGHDVSGPGADEETTETSGPQKSGDSLPTAAACSMPQQREPST